MLSITLGVGNASRKRKLQVGEDVESVYHMKSYDLIFFMFLLGQIVWILMDFVTIAMSQKMLGHPLSGLHLIPPCRVALAQ